MNQNGDALFKLIIPGIFVLLWVLGQVINKENANSNEQQRRPNQDPLGPRPNRAQTAGRRRDDSGLDPNAILTDPRTGRPVAVVFPQAGDPRQASSRQPRQPRRQESGRGRKPSPAPPSRPASTLATPIPQSLPASEAQNIELPARAAPTTAGLIGLRDSLQTPQRIREAIVASFVLGQPPGLARLRRMRGTR